MRSGQSKPRAITAPPGLRMAPNFTVTVAGKHKPISPTVPRRVIAAANRSRPARKITGHVIFLTVGLIALMLECAHDFSPMSLVITQFLLPSIVQEVYDFIRQV